MKNISQSNQIMQFDISVVQTLENQNLYKVAEFFAKIMQVQGFGESIHPGEFFYHYHKSQSDQAIDDSVDLIIASDQGEIVAISSVWHWKREFKVVIDQESFSPELLTQLTNMSEGLLMKSGGGEIITHCWRGNLSRQGVLMEAGYDVQEYEKFYRPNYNELNVKPLPDRFRIENRKNTKCEDNQWIEGRSYSLEFFRKVSAEPVYHPEVDFNVYDENGELAGFATGLACTKFRMGILVDLSISEKYRRNKIGSHLIYEIFDKFKQLSIADVVLTNKTNNEPMKHFLESLSLHPEGISEVWKKNI